MPNIITNNQYRPLLVWDDLTRKEQANFDWVAPEDWGYEFFRYRGRVYSLSEFPRLEEGHPFHTLGYHAISDSGIIIKLSACGDAVFVARFY